MNVADHQNLQRVDPERASRRDPDERAASALEHRQPAKSANPSLTAVIAVVCGVAGAVGYMFIFAAKPAEQSQSKTQGAVDKTSSTLAGEANNTSPDQLRPNPPTT